MIFNDIWLCVSCSTVKYFFVFYLFVFWSSFVCVKYKISLSISTQKKWWIVRYNFLSFIMIFNDILLSVSCSAVKYFCVFFLFVFCSSFVCVNIKYHYYSCNLFCIENNYNCRHTKVLANYKIHFSIFYHDI